VTLFGVELEVCPDAEGVASFVADELVAVARTGGSIALTGGSSPGRAYELSTEREPDWSMASLWWGDERCVPPDDDRSNYRMAKEALLDRLSSPPAAVHRMESVEQYERELAGVGTFDLVLLGLGPDGHIASLFPNFPTLEVDRDVVGSEAGFEPFVDRISLTLPRLRRTRELLFLVAGEDKADAVAHALAGEPSPDTPGSLVRSAEGTTSAILDRAAASKLP
jgi:6-phosphogluconolactonase